MNYFRFLIATFALLISGSAIFAQPGGSASGARDIPGDADAIKAKLRKVTDDAGVYFKQGLINLKDQRRQQARQRMRRVRLDERALVASRTQVARGEARQDVGIDRRGRGHGPNVMRQSASENGLKSVPRSK